MSTSTITPAYMAAPAPIGTPCGVPCHNRRPAIHVLTVSLPVAPVGTALCAYHSPFDPGSARVAPTPTSQGVSLAKAGDLPNGMVMITSVGQEDHLSRVRLDVAHSLLLGQRRGLDRNDLRALSRVFRTLAAQAA